MLANIKRARFENMDFSLIALDDLIQLKMEANRANDRIDIEKLREIHGEG
jgi:predicted nucleotidyltransferase